MSKTTIYFFGADGRKGIKHIGTGNLLRNLQNQVGGHIETVSIVADKDLCFLCNEEGLLLHLPHNPFFKGLIGNIVVIGVEGEDFVSLNENQIDMLQKLFKKPSQKIN